MQTIVEVELCCNANGNVVIAVAFTFRSESGVESFDTQFEYSILMDAQSINAETQTFHYSFGAIKF